MPTESSLTISQRGRRTTNDYELGQDEIQDRCLIGTMRYTSTRGRSVSVSFETAICTGYASDGGLFVPETIPSLTADVLSSWSHFSYPNLAFAILRLFIAKEEISDDDLRSICTSAMQAFDDPDQAIPVVEVGTMYVAELFRGPTFCFKDLGMRVLIGLLSHFTSHGTGKNMTLLVSTTGDTGPAAVQAVADVNNPRLSLLVHYPMGQISDFQRRQLTTVTSDRVKVVAYEGGGDDMDLPIKRILASAPDGKIWTGVNSYNIGRPLMQLVHYVWTYLRVVEQEAAKRGADCDYTQAVTFIIPTGAMGNIAGGYMAKQMGLPIRKLVAAVNANDATHRVFQNGELRKLPMIKTLSEAMNVQIPYNLERLLFYRTGQDHALVASWMRQVESSDCLDLSPLLDRLQEDFASATASDEQVCAAISSAYANHNYYIDPHTAVGWCAAEQLGYYSAASSETEPSRSFSGCPAALLATASPCKFQNAYATALSPDGWKAYAASSQYPVGARRILEGEELPPAIYKAEPTLKASQRAWEAYARDLLRELELPCS
jgi:threonine synthase